MSLNFFKRFASFFEIVTNKPSWILSGGIALAVISTLYAAFHLSFLPNFAGLNSQEVSYSRNYDAFVKEFRVEPDILVVAKGPRPKDNTDFLEALAGRLSQKSYLSRVYYKVDLKPFRAWALAYADNATLEKIADSIKLAKPLFKSLDNRADLTKFWLAIPEMKKTQANIKTSPDQIAELQQFIDLMSDKLEGKAGSLSEMKGPFKDLQVLKETQYITLKEGNYALMFLRPSPDQQGKIVDQVKDIREEIKNVLPRFPNVEAHLTGEPVLGADEMQAAKHDIFWAGLLSLILSSTILILGFGDTRKAILTVIALLVGIGWSLGYITLSVKHLNVFTLSLFPMLIGLAIDFSIQFLGRYLEERAKPSPPKDAIRTTYIATGTGLFTAALITSLGFFAISFTEYKGIAELGVATGGSLLLCFLSTVTILPALLALTEKNGKSAPQVSKTIPFFTVKGTLLERFLLSHAKAIVLIALVLTGLFAQKARHIRFDHNVLNLQAKNTDSVNTELELVQASGKSSLFAVLVADNLQQAEEYTNQLQHLDTVGNTQSPLPFLPQDLNKKLPILKEIKQEVEDFKISRANQPVQTALLLPAFEKIEKMIANGQKKISLASGALELFENFVFPGSQVVPQRSLTTNLADMHIALDNLQQSLIRFLGLLKNTDPQKASASLTDLQSQLYENLRDALTLIKNGIPNRAITLSDLPPEVRNQFVGKTGKILIQVYPAQNIWDRTALERFISQLREVDPNVTGSPVLILETTRAMLESYKAAARIALVVILLVSFAQFRKIRLTLLTLTPLGLGLIWLMGIMVLFHKSFNPANLLTLPIILGIGVAFGVYVINRYREEQHPSIFSTSTGRSVLLSALTSIAGFASLLGVSHQGLQSLGFTMTVGLSAITMQALLVLPSLLEVTG